MQPTRIVLALGLALATSQALAAPYSFNARQDAMGGAGVSSATYLAAPFYNPAMLAFGDDNDDAGILLPVVGVELFDRDDLVSQAGDLNDTYEAYQNAYDAAQANPSTDNINRLLSLNEQATTQLQQLDGASGVARAGAGAAVALPTDWISGALFYNAYADAQALVDINDSDFTTYTDPTTGAALTLPTDENNIQSKGIAVAAVVQDVGLALAMAFEDFDAHWSLGVTPKVQQLHVFNYAPAATADNFDDIGDYEAKKSAFNLDAGLAGRWDSGLTAGLAIKNLFKQELQAPVHNGVQASYELGPIPTASVSYALAGLTLTGDLDLMPQKRFTAISNTPFSGGDDDVQLLALGAEYDLLGWLQLRGGYRQDLQGNLDQAYTAGLGISPFGVFHLDLAGLYAGNREYGAVLQTSLTF